MDRRRFLASGTALAALGYAAPSLAASYAREWEIGPVIRGRNYSVNMPPHPDTAAEGWFFDFPGPRRQDGHVHYVTRRTGPLDRARGLRLRYRIDARPGTRFVPQERPDAPPLLSLYIQRAGDDWRARGDTRFHRWYSPDSRVIELTPGTHELVIWFDENWISVMGSDRDRSPREFAATLANAARIGMTFGTHGGRGHGIFATQPARFTLLDFSVLA
ncbi:hypothetical protein [Aurantiacibacter poecillastricola]|uniref:hypothetical protein n=1 Tax=Aurantiacibacter poecillastricola TaxID=3064385 RepID=UPI00273F6DCB|nr:hypothetical protein [Aurantiacibacter sp. 219JJ12-13]MDP5263456.1 hypothetical protein [Aurantiacibacter sp. 219JJ12-13]